MKQKRIAALGLMMAVLLTGACGQSTAPEENVSGTVVVEEAPEVDADGNGMTADEEADAKLTGEECRSELTNEIIDTSIEKQRPIAVMVDNESIALPHYGLTQADVVYEMMNSTENGRITRLMVLVKDWERIEQLGSIRSARPTNVILAGEWNAVLCHDGGPFYVDEYLAQPWSTNFSGTFSRVNNGKSREYTEYILNGDLDKNFSSASTPTEYTSYYQGPHFQFAAEDTPVDLSQNSDSEAAETVKLPFPHNGSYLEYDKDAKVYNYFEYGKAHVDPANDNAQLCFTNLLIQECDFTELDENGYLIYNVVATKQSGYYVTNGQAVPITWTKKSNTDITHYYDMDGNELTINTGKTYIALVPSDSWDKLTIK